MGLREASDARRYRTIYGFDYYDRELYDLVVETDDTDPGETAVLIATQATADCAPRPNASQPVRSRSS